MNIPTHDEINNEMLIRVDRKVDDSWRHGCYIIEVYQRREDNTYWQVGYRLSHDGETNELQEGIASIVQVFPKEVTIIIYEERK